MVDIELKTSDYIGPDLSTFDRSELYSYYSAVDFTFPHWDKDYEFQDWWLIRID